MEQEILRRLNVIENKLDKESYELISRAGFLKNFHNTHLKKLLAINIDLHLFDGCKDEDVVGLVPMEGMPRVQGSMSMRKVTVKQQREENLKSQNQICKLLRAIEDLLQKENIEVDALTIAKI